jgi:hypothetical protein
LQTLQFGAGLQDAGGDYRAKLGITHGGAGDAQGPAPTARWPRPWTACCGARPWPQPGAHAGRG